MVIEIRDGSEVPIYLQLRNQIVSGISAGALEPGEQLPTVRALAAEAKARGMSRADFLGMCGAFFGEE